MATSFNSPSNPPGDPWEQRTNTKPNSKKPILVVRDDWEDDDDDDEDCANTEVDSVIQSRAEVPHTDADENRRLWEAAETEVVAPMPTLLASRTGSMIPPPAAAFQPALRILKRPQSSSPSQSTPTTTPPPGESIQEREARYAAARERIFGSEGTRGSDKNTPSPKSGSVKIIREPKAPEPTSGKQGPSPGFKGRNRNSKTPPSTQPTTTA